MLSHHRHLFAFGTIALACIGLSQPSHADRLLLDLRYNIQHDSNIDGWRTDVDTQSLSGKLSYIRSIDSRSKLSNSLTLDYATQSIDNDASYWQWQAKTAYTYKLGKAFHMPELSLDGFTQHRHYTNPEYHNSQHHGAGLRLKSHLSQRLSLQAGYQHQIANNAYPATIEWRWDIDDYHGYRAHLGFNVNVQKAGFRYRYYEGKQTAFVSRPTEQVPLRLLVAWRNSKIKTHEYGLHWPLAQHTALDLQFQQYETLFQQARYVNDSTSLMLLHRFSL